MNRLIRIILYITAGCLGIGVAALILSLALGGSSIFRDAADITQLKQIRIAAEDIADGIRERAEVHHNNSHHNGGNDYDMDDYEETDYNEADYDETDYDEDDCEVTVYEGTDFAGEGDMGLLTVDASGIQGLDIDLRHGSLYVNESDDNLVRVSVTGPADDITAECESGRIAIQDNRTGKQGRRDVELYLEIPEGKQFQSISIQVDAGILQAQSSLCADHLTVNADAGEIVMDEVQSQVFSAAVGAGTIEISDGTLGTVELDCGLGTMDIEADIQEDAQVSCGMGSVALELEDGADSVNYVLDCGVGTIQIGDHEYSSGFGNGKRIENGAGITFELKCGMGTISID